MSIIKCPIHQYIEISQLEKDIIDTKIFQRLRGIKQNALAMYTYPTSLATRFDHSLGVMHIGGRIADHVLRQKNPFAKEFLEVAKNEFYKETNMRPMGIRSDIIEAVRLACLLHDIGHFPFSHSIEKVIDENIDSIGFYDRDLINEYKQIQDHYALHEFISYKLVKDNDEIENAIKNNSDADIIYKIACELLNPTSKNPVSQALKSILRGEIDADRMDYLLRDGRISGISFGRYDIERLIFSLELHKIRENVFEILPNIKGLSAVESFFIERLQLYKWLYHHHSVVFYDSALESVFRLCFIERAPLKTLSSELIDFSRFHYKNYCKEVEPPTDDHFLIFKFYDLYKKVNDWLNNENSEMKEWLKEMAKKGKQLDEKGAKKRLEWSKLLLESVLYRKKNHVALWKNKIEFNLVNEKIEKIAKSRMIKEGGDKPSINREEGPFYRNEKKLPTINYIKENYLKSSDDIKMFFEFLWKEYTQAFKGESNYSIVIDRRKVVPLHQLAKGISDQNIVFEMNETKELKKLTDVSTMMKALLEYPGQEIELFAYLFKKDIQDSPSKEEGQDKFAEALVEWLCNKCEKFKKDYLSGE